jgi:hypothetical protein
MNDVVPVRSEGLALLEPESNESPLPRNFGDEQLEPARDLGGVAPVLPLYRPSHGRRRGSPRADEQRDVVIVGPSV